MVKTKNSMVAGGGLGSLGGGLIVQESASDKGRGLKVQEED